MAELVNLLKIKIMNLYLVTTDTGNAHYRLGESFSDIDEKTKDNKYRTVEIKLLKRDID